MYDDEPGVPVRSRHRARSGRECLIVANDAIAVVRTTLITVIHLRRKRSPCRIACRASISSIPAGVPAAAGFCAFDREHFGRIFYNQATKRARQASRRSPPCWVCTAGVAHMCPR